MAAQIIPIELGLTAGNGITLWAPRWVEDGEEWEAFLGHGEHLYVFPDPVALAAFVGGGAENDLSDHAGWDEIRASPPPLLEPDDDHRFDLVGLPELIAAGPDLWSVAELADTVAILHSLAEVCDLAVVDEVLDSADGFALAEAGPQAFAGRAGGKQWARMARVVAERWDDVIDALDALVTTPEVDEAALAAARLRAETVAVDDADSAGDAGDAVGGDDASVAGGGTAAGDSTAGGSDDSDDGSDDDRDPDLVFWDEVGIDCLRITAGGRTGWTLRCYLGDTPVFLAAGGKTLLFASPARLEDYLADPTVENSLTHLDAWTTIREGIAGGEASVLAGPENTYRLDGLADALLAGPDQVPAGQLELAAELLADAGLARGDDEAAAALSTASPLGNLIRAARDADDPDRIPPSPPFDDEVAAWNTLVEAFEATLVWNK